MIYQTCPTCSRFFEMETVSQTLLRCGQCRSEFVAPGATLIEVANKAQVGPTAPQSTVKLPAEFLAKYQLGRMLGRGAFGMVFQASVLATNESVAIKFLTRINSTDVLARFLREGQFMAEINHPNVVRVTEVQELGGHPYLVCEFLSGGTLRERMSKKTQMRPGEAMRIMADLLAGLQACHARGIVHRDLKPENILFDNIGHAKLADLGIAKAYGTQNIEMTAAGTVMGTPLYMSPEQARGESATVGSDIYSAGLVLYELLAGRPPFLAKTAPAMMQMHVMRPPEDVSTLAANLPKAFAALVMKSLSKRVDERPATAADFATGLKRALKESSTLGIRSVSRAPGTDPSGDEERDAPALPFKVPRPVSVLLGALLVISGVGLWMLWVSLEKPVSGSTVAGTKAHEGLMLYRQGKRTEAEEKFREAIVADPTYSRAHYDLGVLLADRGDRAASRESFHKALVFDPKYILAHIALGKSLVATGNLGEGESWFRSALSIDPRAWAARLELANVLFRQGRRKEAADEYETVVKESQDPVALANLGVLKLDEDPLRASTLIQQSLRKDPTRADTHVTMGLIHSRAGLIPEAEEEFRIAVKLDRKNAVAHESLGELLREQSRFKEAEPELRDAVFLNPKNGKAHGWLGKVLEALNRLGEAEKEYYRAIECSPHSEFCQLALGDLRLRQQRKKDAEVAYRAAIDIDPADQRAHAGLAAALKAQGRLEEADAEEIKARAVTKSTIQKGF